MVRTETAKLRMRVRKLRGRKRKVGNVVLDRDDVEAVRDCAVDVVETDWGHMENGDPIKNSGQVSVYPSDKSDTYVKFIVGDEEFEAGDKRQVVKLLRLL